MQRRFWETRYLVCVFFFMWRLSVLTARNFWTRQNSWVNRNSQHFLTNDDVTCALMCSSMNPFSSEGWPWPLLVRSCWEIKWIVDSCWAAQICSSAVRATTWATTNYWDSDKRLLIDIHTSKYTSEQPASLLTLLEWTSLLFAPSFCC